MDHHPSPSKIPLPAPGELHALNRLCRRFILASLVYFAIGIVLGFLMLAGIGEGTSIFSHTHLNLIGFVVFLIYGVGYKLIPTMFAARHTLVSQKMANVHFWVANVGLILMIAADMVEGALTISQLESPIGVFAHAALMTGGLLQVIGAALFIYQSWVMFK